MRIPKSYSGAFLATGEYKNPLEYPVRVNLHILTRSYTLGYWLQNGRAQIFSLLMKIVPDIFQWTRGMHREHKGLNLLPVRLTPNPWAYSGNKQPERKINIFMFLVFFIKRANFDTNCSKQQNTTIYRRPSPKILRHPGQFLLQPQFPRGYSQGNRTQKRGIPDPVGPSGFGMEGIKTPRVFLKENNSSPNSPAKHTSENQSSKLKLI